MMTGKDSATGPLNAYLLRSALVAALGGLLFGFDTAVIAGTTQALTAAFQLTPALLGFTVSSALWGTVLGSIFAAAPSDKHGRVACLRALGVLYVVTALGCAFAWNWYALVSFRALGGLAIGGSSVIGPMYIAEISPADKRGRLVGMFQFSVVLGITCGLSFQLPCRPAEPGGNRMAMEAWSCGGAGGGLLSRALRHPAKSAMVGANGPRSGSTPGTDRDW